MKKMIAICFSLMFLLAVVAGCPEKPGDSTKNGTSGGASTATLGDADNDTMTSADDSSVEVTDTP